MKMLFSMVFCVCLATIVKAGSTDTLLYLCKYSFTALRDSTNKNSAFSDIMHLQIGKESATYYSYLTQLGRRNMEEDKGMPLDEMMQMVQRGRYYPEQEREILIYTYASKQRRVVTSHKNVYCYSEKVAEPAWQLYAETKTLFGETCQKATTFYKGRLYTAWFAPSLPYTLGPWEFIGLPGLILSVRDDKEQFVFECTELARQQKDPVYREYENCIASSKQKLAELKRLFVSNRQEYDRIEWDAPWNSVNPDGTLSPVKSVIRPYNPIDLTGKY